MITKTHSLIVALIFIAAILALISIAFGQPAEYMTVSVLGWFAGGSDGVESIEISIWREWENGHIVQSFTSPDTLEVKATTFNLTFIVPSDTINKIVMVNLRCVGKLDERGQRQYSEWSQFPAIKDTD